MGMIIFIVAVVLVGGGAGWYFKIYKPKQQKAGMDEDIDYATDGPDPYGADEDEQDAEPDDDDGPPWYEDDEDGSAGDDDE